MNSQWLDSLIDIMTHQTMPPVEAAGKVLCFGTVHPDGCMDVALIDRYSGEIREQSMWCAERWRRGWRETAAKRMRRLGDRATPQALIECVPPEARTDPAYRERGNRIGNGEPAVAA